MKRSSIFIGLPVGVILVVLLCPVLWAADGNAIPPELQRWQSWVLDGHEEALCPATFNDGAARRCWWPSSLEVWARPDGGRFEQRWLVFARGWVALPGGSGIWPEGVVVDGRPVPIIMRDNVPAVELQPGNHLIQGRFDWRRMPEVLQVPPASGMLALTVDGELVPSPSIDARGRLWLKEQASPAGLEDRVGVHIFRLIDDTIPMTIMTLLRLDVSGRSREIDLGRVLLQHMVPMALDSQLPVRLDSGGGLFVQARPGRWEVRLKARMPGSVAKLSLFPGTYGEEIWSFKPQHHLRMVEIEGPARVEPGQTEMPAEWRKFSAYQVKPDDTLIFKVLRRGDPEPAPAQLSLSRRLWLDFDGGGMTVQDSISGSLSRQWYLAMLPPAVLGRVVVDGQAQVITSRQGDPKAGVELRRGRLQLVGESRLPSRSATMTAVGWDHDFQKVSGALYLPPGWRLLSAAGVDQVSDTWFQRWSLLDFFLLLIIALAILKLRNWRWSLLALATMVLISNEPGAPRVVWLHILAVLALFPLIADGWLKRLISLWGAGAVVALLLISMPFMVNQIRWGMYPQLAPHNDLQGIRGGAVGVAAAPEPIMLQEAEQRVGKIVSRPKTAAPSAPSPGIAVQSVEQDKAAWRRDPDALIPTGPGLPDWHWQSIRLQWHGPVAKDQMMRLTLVSPAVNMMLAILQVGLLGLMIWGVVDWRPWWRKIRRQLGAGAAAVLVLMAVQGADLAEAQDPGAAFPPGEMLEELRRRLLAPDDCLPRCADISRLELTASGDDVQVMLKVNAASQTAVPLPVSSKSWAPVAIFMDNAPISGLARDNGGILWGMIAPGLHTIVLKGSAGGADLLQLPLPLKPHLATYSATGWEVKGISPSGEVGSSIQLTRKQPKASTGPSGARGQSALPAFLEVRRVLQLGLSWRVQTMIRRLTPLGAPVVASVPLLKNESLISAGYHVENGQVLVNMSANQSQVALQSTLEIVPRIELTAPRTVPWTETWVLDASPIWHCELSGIAVIHHQDGGGTWRPQWQPWPGESVAIAVHRPKAVDGRSLTVQRAGLLLKPGQRFCRGELTLSINTSRGGQHALELPPDANLQGVQVDGRSMPIRQDNQWVSVPLQPGTQTVSLQWHQLAPFSAFYRGPLVKAGGKAVNARVTIKMPGKRWVLLAGGPRWGPAVLFWSYLAVILLAAAGLGRLTMTPLKTWQWTLLGLGLTQVPAPAALVIVGWLLALGSRESRPMPEQRLMYNGLQVVLVLWSLVALVCLFAAVQAGLIGQPDMQIGGNQSDTWTLNWTQDRIDGNLPQPWVLSAPIWVYRALMLAWSLWLALALLGWLKWGWHCITRGGIWRKGASKVKKTASSQTAPS
jgi:hypothetical protein